MSYQIDPQGYVYIDVYHHFVYDSDLKEIHNYIMCVKSQVHEFLQSINWTINASNFIKLVNQKENSNPDCELSSSYKSNFLEAICSINSYLHGLSKCRQKIVGRISNYTILVLSPGQGQYLVHQDLLKLVKGNIVLYNIKCFLVSVNYQPFFQTPRFVY